MAAAHVGQGDLVARGNTSDVWQWSPTTVVKILRRHIPVEWAALEADITSRVHAAGLPAPATDGVMEVDGRPGIVFERIAGESMWQRMKARPDQLPRLVEELVDLQAAFHAVALSGLPVLEARLRSKIDEAEMLPPTERRVAQDVLARLPGGSALCHGDLHPANLLASARGWVVVDWFDAATGHALADLARSSLLMRAPSGPLPPSHHLDGADGRLLERLHRAYLATTRRRGHIDAEVFETWQAVLAVARMSEPVETADLVSAWRGWRTAGAGMEG